MQCLKLTRAVCPRIILQDSRVPACQHIPSPRRPQHSATPFLRRHSTLFVKQTTSSPSRHEIYHSTRAYTSSQLTDIVFPDPHRPDLFYHFVNPPTPMSRVLPAYALSFLKTTPPAVNSATVIGWLPAQTYTTDTPELPEESASSQPKERMAALYDFSDNPKFIALLHSSIKSALREGLDDIWKNTAIQLESGWMHIHDQRNIPALDRTGNPDDIIASVLVENSKMNVDTYQPMPSYRVCTSDGILQLTPGLAKHLHEDLVKITNETPAS